jgi:DNA-binding NtrC family response regulator
MARVILLGLPQDLANQLAGVLHAENHQVSRKTYIQDLQRGRTPTVVFVSGDSPEYPETLAALREIQPQVPVVVVSRTPETRQWLDALEAGAMDYCGAPFEQVQVRWVMNSALSQAARQQAAA